MEKVIRDGQVAVLYSPGFGAGWYTWNSEHPQCVFDPELVAAVEEGDRQKAAYLAGKKFGARFYSGGARDLEIAWIAQGQAFEIREYDGNESIHFIGQGDWLTT